MEFLKTEMKNKGWVIKLSRPEKRNAFHSAMIKELDSAFKSIPNDAHYVLVEGEGKSFCAGADLDYMKGMIEFSLEQNIDDSNQLFEMFKSAYDCPVPLISNAHGHAMGGGLGLLAVSDYVFAESETKFCFSEVKLGLVPAVISSFVLMKSSHPKVKELLMSGAVFGVEEAKLAQLLSEGTLEQTAQDLERAELNAIRETKRLIRNFYEVNWLRLKDETCLSIAKKRVSSEAQSRLKQFLQRSV
ncbi:MAG: enoyl-CoA hydratase/isomerase family protein [Bdellovibrionales bacterium]|nr:enoyl-CoA hydratase/isomerase family protein [Bdellovibrionales bacterium]